MTQRHRPLLPLLALLFLLGTQASGAAATSADGGRVVGSFVASPGAPLFFFEKGPLTFEGTFLTQAAPTPGVDGPNVTLRSETLVVLRHVEIRAGDGAAGKDVHRIGPAEGGYGGRGGSIIVQAPRIVMENVTLIAGDGGRGGVAASRGNPHALAIGGNGGPGGGVILLGSVEGAAVSRDGDGGEGGAAFAEGKTSEPCSAEAGEADTQHGGNGTALSPDGKEAGARGGNGTCGPWDGTGGPGGDARAYGGQGSISINGQGGRGGNATAIGGRGGDGRDACFATTEEAMNAGITRAGNGGVGGRLTAVGGNGGNSSFRGGDGGNAYAENSAGKGGNATMPIAPGSIGPVGSLPDPDSPGVIGGNGGEGLFGGNGGAATLNLKGGDAGSYCGPPMTQSLIPAPSLPNLLLTLVAFALTRKDRT